MEDFGTLMGSFRVIKRERKATVKRDPDYGAQYVRNVSPRLDSKCEDQVSTPTRKTASRSPRQTPSPLKKTLFYTVPTDPDVQKCKGAREWRVRIPSSPGCIGVGYMSFASLAAARNYAEALRNPPPPKPSPKYKPRPDLRRGRIRKSRAKPKTVTVEVVAEEPPATPTTPTNETKKRKGRRNQDLTAEEHEAFLCILGDVDLSGVCDDVVGIGNVDAVDGVDAIEHCAFEQQAPPTVQNSKSSRRGYVRTTQLLCKEVLPDDSPEPVVLEEAARTIPSPLTLPPSIVDSAKADDVETPYSPPWSPSSTLVANLDNVRVVSAIAPHKTSKRAFKASLFELPGAPSLQKSITFVPIKIPPLLHAKVRRFRPCKSKASRATFSDLVSSNVFEVMASIELETPAPVAELFV